MKMITAEPIQNKVVILTAGIGSRLNQRTRFFNKCLLRVGNKAVISYIIDAFPVNTQFIIALGYKGNLVQQFLQIAYPEHNFIFIEIDKYSCPGAGPGYAMLKCKDKLQSPFYFFSCDSMLSSGSMEKFLNIQTNCAAIAEAKDPSKYCTVDLSPSNEIIDIKDKQPTGYKFAYTGVSYVKDYQDFWVHLEAQNPSIDEEIQIAPSLLSLKNLQAIKINWLDTGSEEGLLQARQLYPGIDNLDKIDEELYVIDDRVIKYFHNESMVQNRLKRAEYLKDLIPNIEHSSKNYYSYKFVFGKDFFKVPQPEKHILNLLNFTKEKLWTEKPLNELDLKIFRDSCKKFYYDKTWARISKFLEKLETIDQNHIINGQNVKSIKEIFKTINWDYIAEGHCSNFHGDFNFGNILLQTNNSFKFLDHRQDFCGLIEYGDAYYDLAKLYHSFLFPHESIKNDKYYINKNDNKIKIFIEVPTSIEKCKDIFEQFVVDNGFDLWKVKVLTGIVLLNMSPLHESPIDEYLYYFSKMYLNSLTGAK